MKGMKVIVLAVLAVVFFTAAVMATEGVERGKEVFNDPKLGTSGKSCASCHPDGKGMAAAVAKSKWTLSGKEFTSLDDVINACVTGPLKGTALAKDSAEMRFLKMYMESLGGGAKQEKKEEVQFGC